MLLGHCCELCVRTLSVGISSCRVRSYSVVYVHCEVSKSCYALCALSGAPGIRRDKYCSGTKNGVVLQSVCLFQIWVVSQIHENVIIGSRRHEDKRIVRSFECVNTSVRFLHAQKLATFSTGRKNIFPLQQSHQSFHAQQSLAVLSRKTLHKSPLFPKNSQLSCGKTHFHTFQNATFWKQQSTFVSGF